MYDFDSGNFFLLPACGECADENSSNDIAPLTIDSIESDAVIVLNFSRIEEINHDKMFQDFKTKYLESLTQVCEKFFINLGLTIIEHKLSKLEGDSIEEFECGIVTTLASYLQSYRSSIAASLQEKSGNTDSELDLAFKASIKKLCFRLTQKYNHLPLPIKLRLVACVEKSAFS